MGKKFLVGVTMIALPVLLIGCGNTTAPSPSLSAPAPPHIYVHTPPSHTDSPLVGIYTTTITRQDLVSHPELMEPQSLGGGINILGTWILTYKSDGSYTALNGNYKSGEQYIGSGFYSVTQNRLTILSDSKCLEFYVPINGPGAESGMFTWSLQGNSLKLKVIRDLCTVRNVLFTTHPWAKQS